MTALGRWVRLDGYDDGHPFTSPVGTFPANEFGLYDLGGNAAELVTDARFSDNPDHVRGGSWSDFIQGFMKSASRSSASLYAITHHPLPNEAERPQDPSSRRSNRVGFRVVLDPGAAPKGSG